MLKTSILLVLGSMLLVGCSSDSTSSASGTTEPAAGTTAAAVEKAKCAKCGTEAAKTAMTEKDGQLLCEHCKGA